MDKKELLEIMKQKENDENNNYSFFGNTGLQVIIDKNKFEIVGRYSPELQVAWIYPDKIYTDIYSISEAEKLIKK